MAGSKDDPLPESTMRLIWESKAAQEEEWRRQEEWIEHYNSTYPQAGSGVATPVTAYRMAARVTELDERGAREGPRGDTPRLARAYIAAIRKRQDAMSIVTAEFAVSHPELLDVLNRGL